ncbi:MAG: TIGR00341 family protein [Armatimonadetes bacterium]|nr:TIGR00341 family protein [Armatimonadota bacterium]
MDASPIQSEILQAPEPGGLSKHQAQIRRTIATGAMLSSPYLIMNALATVVAAYGLLANSTAVVIGAMIIAMLLGPIMGLALALVDGDTLLLKNAVIAEVVGVGMVLILGYVIGHIHGDLPITEEILARTKPNLLDLAVALAGGAAGAYATVSPRVSVGLVGVAISTALVPPLAVCGICVSRSLYDLAAGAFILFLTNLVAIQVASSVVLFAFGYHKVTHRDPGDTGFVRRLVIDAALFLGLSVFLYVQLGSTVREQRFEEDVKIQLERGLVSIPGAYLAETRFRTIDKKSVVVALVRAPNSITPEQTKILQDLLPTVAGRPTELHVRSQLTKETTVEGYLHVIEPKATPIEDVQSTASDTTTEITPLVPDSHVPQTDTNAANDANNEPPSDSNNEPPADANNALGTDSNNAEAGDGASPE